MSKLIVALIACLLLVNVEEVLAQGTTEVDAAFEAAARLHQSGDLDGAIRGYQAILSKHPERVDVRSNLGAAFSRLGRYEEAIAQYKQALAQ
ncbi:MAG: tetratricopeptide repeat protein, partial [Blastocatellia bacterium]|nr:tetratricopeptide repeat protein [Blastocatellia bacterium]